MKIFVKIRLHTTGAVLNKLIDICFQIIRLVNHTLGRLLRIIGAQSGPLPKFSIYICLVFGKESHEIIQIVPLAEHTMILIQIFLIKTYTIKPILIYFYNFHFYLRG